MIIATWHGRRGIVDLATIEREVASLDLLLAPIAQEAVDVTDPDWQAKLASVDSPARQPGVEERADAVLRAIIDRYARGDDRARTAIRHLFDRYSSFGWAVHLPREWHGEAAFRDRLIHLSARDQDSDTRDELLRLRDLLTEAEAKGINTTPILTEVAAMSSDVDRYGMGSTRALLLRCAGG